jgi:TolA protein
MRGGDPSAKAFAEAEERRRQQEEPDKRCLAQEGEEARICTQRIRAAQLAAWQAQIAARIERAWLRPPSAQPGFQCEQHVMQDPGGQASRVTIHECDGDQAVRTAVARAVYWAAPLPPPEPSLFDPDLLINFVPRSETPK